VPLVITIPPGWRTSAGIGAPPGATDITHGWRPVSIRAAIASLRDDVDAIIAAHKIPLAPDIRPCAADARRWRAESVSWKP
jgi:hypothetical protein